MRFVWTPLSLGVAALFALASSGSAVGVSAMEDRALEVGPKNRTSVASNDYLLTVDSWPVTAPEAGASGFPRSLTWAGPRDVIVGHAGGGLTQLTLSGDSSFTVSGRNLELMSIVDKEGSASARLLDLERVENRLFVTVLSSTQGCTGVKLLRGDLQSGRLSPKMRWKTIWRMRPCLDPLLTRFGEDAVFWSQSGGRLAWDPDKKRMFVSVGDFAQARSDQTGRWKGYPGEDFEFQPSSELLQNRASDLGSVVALRNALGKEDIEVQKWVQGLRNPQGLAFDRGRRVLWESEHGPAGGDEVNQLVRGGDYGWPQQSYGRPYGPDGNGGQIPNGGWNTKVFSTKESRKFKEPTLAFAPSIAPSEMAVWPTSAKKLKLWRGDLLLATLKDGGLHRLIVSDVETNKIVLSERVQLGYRLRDMALRDGQEIWFVTDDSRLVRVSGP